MNSIVEQHRGRAPSVSAVENELQKAVGEGGEKALLAAPAGAVEEDRQHTDAHAAALRQLEELDIAQRGGGGYHQCALGEGAGLGLGHGFSPAF